MPPKEGGENEWLEGQGGRTGRGEEETYRGETESERSGSRDERGEGGGGEIQESSFFTPVDENGTTNPDKSLEG